MFILFDINYISPPNAVGVRFSRVSDLCGNLSAIAAVFTSMIDDRGAIIFMKISFTDCEDDVSFDDALYV